MTHLFATGPVLLHEDGDELRKELGLALSDVLGESIVVRAEHSYGALRERLFAGEVALAWTPPALFVSAEQRGVIGTLLRAERFAGARYQGALFVRADSPIQSAEDLQGHSIAWVDRESCAGFLFPRLALRMRNLDPDRIFTRQVFATSHSKVVRAVADGTVDVGATYVNLADPDDVSRGVSLSGWAPFVPDKDMRAVVISPSIPSDAVCISAAITPALRDTWRDRLASAHTKPKVARLLRALLDADRLTPGESGDYEPVLRAVRAEQAKD